VVQRAAAVDNAAAERRMPAGPGDDETKRPAPPRPPPRPKDPVEIGGMQGPAGGEGRRQVPRQQLATRRATRRASQHKAKRSEATAFVSMSNPSPPTDDALSLSLSPSSVVQAADYWEGAHESVGIVDRCLSERISTVCLPSASWSSVVLS
jgi:hypothetical protein